MGHIAIVADDLSGASDTGVGLIRHGLDTLVVFDAEGPLAEANTVAVDTDSRAVSAQEAYLRVADATRRIRLAGYQHIYKKLDSTLRGNLGAELDAAMDTLRPDFTVVAPAFPRMGRTTTGGRQCVHGMPVSQTEGARDPRCPVRGPDLVALLSSQSGRKVGLVRLATLRASEDAVLSEIDALKEDGTQLIVFDAETDGDLRRIAYTASGSRYRILWAGSGGLIGHLPDALGLSCRDPRRFHAPPCTKPVILVAGSNSDVTREQIGRFELHPGAVGVQLDARAAAAGGDTWEGEIGRCRSRVAAGIAKGDDVALYVGVSTCRTGDAEELDSPSIPGRIAGALGRVASEVASAYELRGLILTGGDTARAVCQALGAAGIQLLGEVEAGMPIGRLVGGGLLVVTKAGAFGTQQTLVRALQALKGDG